MTKPKFLVTGTSSGLGQYLLGGLRGKPFYRANLKNEINRHGQNYYDAIVHCAADTRNVIPPNDLWPYYQSNIELTKQLTQIPHGLFVYISSPAVYPDPYRESKETDVPNFPETSCPVHHTYYLYGLFKLLAEQVVLQNSKSPLILRCVSIVGPTTRPATNIMKILCHDPSPLTLSPESSFNLVSMSQIKEFIELALTQNITGIFNAGSTQNATLREIAEALGSQPKFGSFIHNVHRMNTDKIRSVSTGFNKSTLEIAEEVLKELKDLQI
ncbi:MAG: hypothetical protein A3B86_02780 [Candidatus Yanofskybacteria bacterium RIFCSPHIGHO2_02_FULL_38_22b]|uniref:NAD-dependent epimerase/dehydratase domain-containing protein n=1 Tax=Candidatus Yanofskybacteria bacterium RIFCSPHIGHO2_02_FULL_38_22b TaxID=1802673 RepID=A0A1F8F5B4_9BACT|nr:MAG: hypothetical protein A2816_03075 [Candidatus Yanofskybacteria bacterium RIFCSPHIGHO2_01_FULL_39_44]OGN07780.1 MAG: hypothetical protein A3B86_02780 [Candidatus Yanofskybacteria bacterium RIFCSPHIGHO2_02_FULL_38_22b]OGN20663.1 MAG: hypothetical protein A2910_02615 [Candidatus Yanofskybacteria bacterium RIFCSPLOWO2_01_FULL_39_28]